MNTRVLAALLLPVIGALVPVPKLTFSMRYRDIGGKFALAGHSPFYSKFLDCGIRNRRDALIDSTRNQWKGTVVLYTKDTDENNEDEQANSFDAGGFASYLAPYAIALIASVVATAAVFKFVLLDY